MDSVKRPRRKGTDRLQRRQARATTMTLALLAIIGIVVVAFLMFNSSNQKQTHEMADTAATLSPQQKPSDEAQALPAKLPAPPVPASSTPRLVESFTIEEHFGVPHPDQIIELDLDAEVDSSGCYMVNSDGSEVPCQLLEGGKKVAVRTALKVGEQKTWELMAGRPPAAFDGTVKVEEMKTKGYCEITNGLTGVRVAMPQGEGSSRGRIPAPVQGIRLRDGTWTAIGPNALVAPWAQYKRFAVDFVERGPLKAILLLKYTFDRQAKTHNTRDGRVDIPAGECFYSCRVEVQAGQPSCRTPKATSRMAYP